MRGIFNVSTTRKASYSPSPRWFETGSVETTSLPFGPVEQRTTNYMMQRWRNAHMRANYLYSPCLKNMAWIRGTTWIIIHSPFPYELPYVPQSREFATCRFSGIWKPSPQVPSVVPVCRISSQHRGVKAAWPRLCYLSSTIARDTNERSLEKPSRGVSCCRPGEGRIQGVIPHRLDEVSLKQSKHTQIKPLTFS